MPTIYDEDFKYALSAHFLFALFIALPPFPFPHILIIYVNVLMLQLNGSHYGCIVHCLLVRSRVLLKGIMIIVMRLC